MNEIKILQNQERFTTQEYKQYVSPLIDVLNKKRVHNSIKKLWRNGFMAGLLMYVFAGDFNVIVTVGHRASMVYGLLSRLFPRKGKIQIAKEFYFEEHINFSLKKHLLDYVYRFSFKNLTMIAVNSSREIEPYSKSVRLPESMFHFIPWPSAIDNPEIIESNDNYILAVGISLRDWKTFFVSIKGLKQKFVVVASKKDMEDLTIPDNTELYTDIPYDKYKDLLRHSIFVVIPLIDTQRSSGQASFLEAMGYGKPVIVSRVIGALDYIEDGHNGLLYTPGDEKDLCRKITQLYTDTSLQKKLAINGLQSITEKFNKKYYAKEMVILIKKLFNGKMI